MSMMKNEMKEEKLTPSQKEAIEYTKTPLLIVAGAGSGKTKVLAHKTVYLMEEQNYKPSEILLTTFTIKASEEIRKRVETLSKKDVSSMFIGTVHSLCERIIKEKGSKEVYTGFEVLDDFKRYLFIKRNLSKLGLNVRDLKNLKRVQADNEIISLLQDFFDTLTENLIEPKTLKEKVLHQTSTHVESIISYNHKKDKEIGPEKVKEIISSLIDSYNKYQNLLDKNKYLDFAHLELFAYKIISKNPEILKQLQDQYKYIMIDEFQDINPLQWRILSTIALKGNISCVGDKNQSIYGFRGANPHIFDNFNKFYSNAKNIKLEENFRSRKEIIDISNVFLRKRSRTSLELKETRKEHFEVFHLSSENELESSIKILNFIKDLKQKKIINRYGDVAILFRSLKKHGKSFIKQLDTQFQDIPYAVFGGTNFLENEAIRGMLFLLAYVYHLNEDKDTNELTLFSDIGKVFTTNLLKNQNKLEIIQKLDFLREKISELTNISIEKTMYTILGILNITKKEDGGENLKILYDLGKLSEIIVHFSNFYNDSDMGLFLGILNELPEKVNLNKKTEEVETVDNNSLYLMNIHQAKGLQFPIVIVPSLIGRRFPILKSGQKLLEIPKEFYLYEPYEPIKEEENLFYVAMTRAKELLILSDFKKYESEKKTPSSKFLEEVQWKTKKFDQDKLFEIKIEDKPEENIDIKLIDYSALSTFIDCQERFKMNYLYGFKAQQIFLQKVGLIYHNCIAKINQNISDKEKIDEEGINKIMDDSWIDLANKNEVFRKKIFNGLRNYVNFMSKDFKRAIGIEKPVSVAKDKLRIRGRTDFIYENKKGEIVLMDYKARKLESIEETHVDYQLKFYNDALKKEGLKIDKAIAYPIEEENIDKKINKAIINIKSDKEIHHLLNEFSECMKNKQYEGTKRGSQFCKECPYKPMCKYHMKEKKK